MEMSILSRMRPKRVQEIGSPTVKPRSPQVSSSCFNTKRFSNHEILASLRYLYQANLPLAEDERPTGVSPDYISLNYYVCQPLQETSMTDDDNKSVACLRKIGDTCPLACSEKRSNRPKQRHHTARRISPTGEVCRYDANTTYTTSALPASYRGLI